MTPRIHYIVRHALLTTNEQGEYDVEVFTNQIFQHDEPIIARNEAFASYENYQTVVDEYRKLNIPKEVNKKAKSEQTVEVSINESESIKGFSKEFKTALEKLQSLPIYPLLEWRHTNLEKHDMLTPHGDAVVILVRDKSLIENEYDDNSELIIHRTIKPSDDSYDVDDLMSNLDTEYNLYQEFGYHTANQSTREYYWDSERYYEGNENEEWESYHTILKTPFDWTPYSKENWWNDPEFFVNYQQRQHDRFVNNLFNQHQELIKGGETETVEFKPLLFGTIPGKDKYDNPKPRNMGLEVAQVICSFMNKHGGNIYIGVKDNGTIQGVDLERKNSEDDYIRAFTTMKRYFFGHEPSLVYHYINGRFITVEEKRLFCITVKESKDKRIRPTNYRSVDFLKFCG